MPVCEIQSALLFKKTYNEDCGVLNNRRPNTVSDTTTLGGDTNMQEEPTTTSGQAPESAPFIRARPHHFQFAFKVMPQFVNYDPKKFRDAALTNKLPGILRNLWMRIGEELPESERQLPGELTSVTDEIHGYTRVIVLMPPAERPNECIYIAVFLRIPFLALFDKSKIETRILTLERSYPLEGRPTNAVCTISAEGTHGIFGVGPDDLEGFKSWTADFIKDK